MKLNLGCGQNRREGYRDFDKYPTFAPDLIWDLEATPYPFDSNSITEIAATHVLEHLGQRTETFLAIMKELYRLLVPSGTIEIKAPHFRGTRLAEYPVGRLPRCRFRGGVGQHDADAALGSARALRRSHAARSGTGDEYAMERRRRDHDDRPEGLTGGVRTRRPLAPAAPCCPAGMRPPSPRRVARQRTSRIRPGRMMAPR